jgi:hypothetical protein
LNDLDDSANIESEEEMMVNLYRACKIELFGKRVEKSASKAKDLSSDK